MNKNYFPVYNNSRAVYQFSGLTDGAEDRTAG